MKLPASQALHAYWSSLCQGRCAPERSDLDPAAMRHVLAQTFILEVDAGQQDARGFPIRLSGTRLDALFNRDLKGFAFVDLWAEADRDLVRGIADHVLDEALPAVIGGCAGPAGAAQLGFELLLLPLRHLGKTHARMLGGLAFAETPSWLGLQAAQALSAKSWRTLAGAAAPGKGEPALGDAAQPDAPRVRLVVHEGGRSPAPTDLPSRQARVKPVLSHWANRC